jgi:hypothetical protein
VAHVKTLRLDEEIVRRPRPPVPTKGAPIGLSTQAWLMTFGVLCGVAASTGAHEQAPPVSITWRPARVLEGAVAEITVRAESGATPGVDSVSGVVAGEPLHFEPSDRSFWALVPVPLGTPDTLQVALVLRHGSEFLGTVVTRLPVQPRPGAMEVLKLSAPFNEPPDSAAAVRLASEAAQLDSVRHRAHSSPRLWHEAFLRPVPGRVTDAFGIPRLIDGMPERHLGVDLAGSQGRPVRAANRGIVALVSPLYESGLTVVVDHGGGLVTSYAHLSLATVTVGDTIERGRVIGRVGSTGEATGPHLHWAAFYGRLALDPLSLLTLEKR